MIWPLFIPILSAYAVETTDLSALQKLDDELPAYQTEDATSGNRRHRYYPPNKKIHWDEIEESGFELISILAGKTLIKLETNQSMPVEKSFYAKVYRRPDEFGFKYVINKDGSLTYKIHESNINIITQEVALYEPPAQYQVETLVIPKNKYDKTLTLLPEAVLSAGVVNGKFMADLLDNNNANKGYSTQIGGNLVAKWKYPLRIGAALRYENAQYNTGYAGGLKYSAFSFGPLFRSKDLGSDTFAFRIQTQYRISPWARATTSNIENNTYQFNSSDWLTSIDHPIKNRWGEFVLGLYVQYQWLSLKNQKIPVELNGTNLANQSLGVNFSQVFE